MERFIVIFSLISSVVCYWRYIVKIVTARWSLKLISQWSSTVITKISRTEALRKKTSTNIPTLWCFNDRTIHFVARVSRELLVKKKKRIAMQHLRRTFDKRWNVTIDPTGYAGNVRSLSVSGTRARVHTFEHRISTFLGTDNVITLFACRSCHSDTEGGRTRGSNQGPGYAPFDSVLQFVTDEVSSNFRLTRVKRFPATRRTNASVYRFAYRGFSRSIYSR